MGPRIILTCDDLIGSWVCIQHEHPPFFGVDCDTVLRFSSDGSADWSVLAAMQDYPTKWEFISADPDGAWIEIKYHTEKTPRRGVQCSKGFRVSLWDGILKMERIGSDLTFDEYWTFAPNRNPKDCP